MRKLLTLFMVLGLLACGTSAANAVVVIGDAVNNGNLDQTFSQLIIDNPPPGPDPTDLHFAKPTVWQNVGTRAISGAYEDEMSSEAFAGGAPTPATADGTGLGHPDGCGGTDCGVFFKPFSGNATDGKATGHLFQDNPGTPGLKYTLTGWAGAEANALMTDAVFAVEFLDGGGVEIPLSGAELSLLPTLFVDNGQPFDYKMYTVMATAPAGTVSVRARASMIDAMGNPAGGGQAFVVDDFTLTGIPEPASVMLGLIGVLGLMGLVRRR